MIRYIVFDLDATLGNMNTIYFLLRTLRPRNFWKEQPGPTISPNPVEGQLENVYRTFVKEVAQNERSSNPLGIVRPGIFRVLEHIPNTPMIIYSNNGDINLSECIRDILRSGINNPTAIDECVTWFHPIRQATEIAETRHLLDKSDEDAYPWPGGRSPKTWATLQEILQRGPLQATNVQPQEVLFLDDNMYPDLKLHLQDNYLRVSRYNYKCPLDPLLKILEPLLETIDWTQYSKLLSESIPGCTIQSVSDLRTYLETNTRKTDSAPIPNEDVETMIAFVKTKIECVETL